MILVHVLPEVGEHEMRPELTNARLDRADDVQEREAVEPLIRQIAEDESFDSEDPGGILRALPLPFLVLVSSGDAIGEQADPYFVSPVDVTGDGAPHTERLVVRVGRDHQNSRDAVPAAVDRGADHGPACITEAPAGRDASRASSCRLWRLITAQKQTINTAVLVR